MTTLTRIITADVASEYLATQHDGERVTACLFAVGALLGGKRAGVAIVDDRAGTATLTRLCAESGEVGSHLHEAAWAEARSMGYARMAIGEESTCAHGWKETAPAPGEAERGPVDGAVMGGGAPPTPHTLQATGDGANYRETLGAAKAFAPKTRWGKLEVVGPVVWRQQRAHVVVKCHCPVGEPFEAACRDLHERRVVNCGQCLGLPGERPDGTPMPWLLVRVQKHERPGVIAGFESEHTAALERDRIVRNPGCEGWVIEIRPNDETAAPKRQRKVK